MRRALALVLIAPCMAVAACGDDDDSAGTATESGTTAADGCRDVSAPRPKADGGQRRPTAELDQAKRYDVTLATTCGRIVIRLDQRTSPATAASFAALARAGFLDQTVFHRIVPGFVIQGGDPTASGSGGPGYSTRDVPPREAAYTKGVVAMAKTADEPPGTAGSQFYIVTGADAGLPPEYALLGKVVRGMEAAERISALGDTQSGDAGTPLKPIVIEKATVSSS